MADFTSLARSVKGEVVTPEDPGYDAAIARWAKNAERKARVVVFVKNAEDVVHAIAFAKENQLPFAVRGGGHNAGGASSAEGGLVIDLSRHLNNVRVDAEQKLGYVGGGALWRDVDAEAIKYGLATVGGTINHTGVGGLTLGGGYGWLTGRYGLTIDNLVQVTIVAADGSVLTVNETENTDLFWAVRGGGGNFGVVTEFVYRLHPQRKTVFAGHVIFTPDKVEKLVEVTKQWWDNVKADEGMVQIATVGPDGRPAVITMLFYNGSEEEGRANYKAFFDIGPVMDMAKEIPYEQLNSLQNPFAEYGKGYYLKGVTQSSPDHRSISEVLDRSAKIAAEGIFRPALIYEYLPLEKVNAVPIPSTAFRRQFGSNILTSISWEGSLERTNGARDVAKELIDIVMRGEGAEELGYANYGHDLDMPDSKVGHPSGDHLAQKAEAAFASNYPKLQQIKKIYDPENVFNRWFPITPA
ncbi:hypothetical protein EST38_g388 [Candolleomyces aberdarensis]|uniref:FAD-binding PCMH-type domain-containing protein n=1 Tax=Candolleomyces aberdarensis TaxID=2316362 RepID=A0A4Q2DXI7_9AGAR|nr:hypothetical protein EST38_g388 [Candolleomyces aberdarensis]